MRPSKILNLSLALLCITLFSCTEPPKPEIKRHVFSVVVQESPNLHVHGTQEWAGNRCVLSCENTLNVYSTRLDIASRVIGTMEKKQRKNVSIKVL